MIEEAKRWETYSQVLSAKDIRLSYSQCASTASYDLLTHEVILPMWDCLDEESTQALTSHEIGHAKFSDYELEAFKDLFARYKDLFNVVEDARIERLMKQEFKGLNRIFKDGYSILANEGIFPLDGIDKASLVERLNIFAKFGFMVEVPFFNKEESSFAFRLMNLSTKADVVDLCEDVYVYLKEKIDEESNQQDELKASDDGTSLDQQNENGEDADDGLDASASSSSNGGSGKRKSSEVEGKETKPSSLDGMLEDGRTRQFAESIEKMHIEERESNDSGKPIVLRSKDILDETYMKLDKDHIKKFECGSRGKRNRKKLIDMVERAAAEAAALFSQKKSALENSAKRRMHSGRLDTRKLAKHSVSDAIFRVTEKLPKGKNHGVVLLLDLSSSMGRDKNVQKCACLQAAILARFCQIVGIDFSIIGFGCELISCWSRTDSKVVIKLADSSCLNLDFLVSVATMSSSSIVRIKEENGNFYSIGLGGCTPTIEGLIAAREEVKAMRGRGVEKAAIIISTDGGYSTQIHSTDERIYVGEAKRILLDGKAFKVSDLKGLDASKASQARDWGFELVAGYIRKETGASIIFSCIGSDYTIKLAMDIWKGVEVQADNGHKLNVGWKSFEPYLFKHMYVSGQNLYPIDFESVFFKTCTSMSIAKPFLIDNYIVMNSSKVFIEKSEKKDFNGLESDDIVAKLVLSNRTLEACKAFAKAFVEFFS